MVQSSHQHPPEPQVPPADDPFEDAWTAYKYRTLPQRPSPVTAEKVAALRAAVQSILGITLRDNVTVHVELHLYERKGDTPLYLDLIGDAPERHFEPDAKYGSREFVCTTRREDYTALKLFLQLERPAQKPPGFCEFCPLTGPASCAVCGASHPAPTDQELDHGVLP